MEENLSNHNYVIREKPTEKYERHIIFILGYTQSKATPIGLTQLHYEIDIFSRNDPDFNRTRIDIYPYRSDWRAIAVWIWRHSIKEPIIDVFAYSWGAGYGFKKFSKELQKHNLKINQAVLLDPVKYKYLPGLAQLVAFTPWQYIRLRTNIKYVQVLRQRNSFLKGHPVLVQPPTKFFEHAFDKTRTHNEMDESPLFKKLVREICFQ